MHFFRVKCTPVYCSVQQSKIKICVSNATGSYLATIKLKTNSLYSLRSPIYIIYTMSYSNGLITFVFLLYLINILCGLRTKSSSAPQSTEIAPHINQTFFFSL